MKTGSGVKGRAWKRRGQRGGEVGVGWLEYKLTAFGICVNRRNMLGWKRGLHPRRLICFWDGEVSRSHREGKWGRMINSWTRLIWYFC